MRFVHKRFRLEFEIKHEKLRVSCICLILAATVGEVTFATARQSKTYTRRNEVGRIRRVFSSSRPFYFSVRAVRIKRRVFHDEPSTTIHARNIRQKGVCTIIRRYVVYTCDYVVFESSDVGMKLLPYVSFQSIHGIHVNHANVYIVHI